MKAQTMCRNGRQRWLPSPLLSLLLLVLWLLLNQSVEPAHLLLGALLAWLLPLWTAPLGPLPGRFSHPLKALRLGCWALWEVARSCYNVSRIIVISGNKANSAFIRVPLDLRDPTGLAVLSCLINCTPGTVWIEVDNQTHELVLHVFDLQDTQWWIDTIKHRYEAPLRQIFEAGGGQR